MNDLAPLLVVMSSLATVFGVSYLFFTTRNKERMAMIEKGLDASLLTSSRRSKHYNSLRFGLLFVGIGTGILMGFLLNQVFYDMNEVAYFSMILLCGGGGLLLHHRITNKEENNKVSGDQVQTHSPTS